MDLVKTKLAAELLNESFPKSDEYWVQFLKNNRRAGRKPIYRIPFRNIQGDAWYDRADLALFIEWETYRLKQEMNPTRYAAMWRHSFEMWESKEIYAKRIQYRMVAEKYEGKPYISLTIHDAKVTFKLLPEEAKNLIQDLNDAIKTCETKILEENVK
jgi:hypothetical protein